MNLVAARMWTFDPWRFMFLKAAGGWHARATSDAAHRVGVSSYLLHFQRRSRSDESFPSPRWGENKDVKTGPFGFWSSRLRNDGSAWLPKCCRAFQSGSFSRLETLQIHQEDWIHPIYLPKISGSILWMKSRIHWCSVERSRNSLKDFRYLLSSSIRLFIADVMAGSLSG